jgi:hypothetical protein
MFDWIIANLNLISTLSNVAMLLVWVIYTRLFYKNFRRQRTRRRLSTAPSANLSIQTFGGKFKFRYL